MKFTQERDKNGLPLEDSIDFQPTKERLSDGDLIEFKDFSTESQPLLAPERLTEKTSPSELEAVRRDLHNIYEPGPEATDVPDKNFSRVSLSLEDLTTWSRSRLEEFVDSYLKLGQTSPDIVLDSVSTPVSLVRRMASFLLAHLGKSRKEQKLVVASDKQLQAIESKIAPVVPTVEEVVLPRLSRFEQALKRTTELKKELRDVAATVATHRATLDKIAMQIRLGDLSSSQRRELKNKVHETRTLIAKMQATGVKGTKELDKLQKATARIEHGPLHFLVDQAGHLLKMQELVWKRMGKKENMRTLLERLSIMQGSLAARLRQRLS